MPSHVVRAVYTRMLPYLPPEMRLVSATKGLEAGSLMRVSEVIRDVIGPGFSDRRTLRPDLRARGGRGESDRAGGGFGRRGA